MEGIDTRNSAESWIGAELFIEKTTLPQLEEGTYYWFEIIGLSVCDVEGAYLGRVESILPTGSNDVYVVTDHENEILIPAIESVVLDIDLEKGRMAVAVPEGL